MENNLLHNALYNAFGSKKNFEREIINLAFKCKYKGSLYLKLSNLLNLSLDNKLGSNEYSLMKINLEEHDIYNFIEELDYRLLEESYKKARVLAKS